MTTIMTRSLFPLVILGLVGLSACTPRALRYYPAVPVSADSLAHSSYDVDNYRETYDGHDGVYIEKELTVEHYLQGQDWSASLHSRLRFMILNEDAEWITTFRVQIDPGESLKTAWVTTMAPDGTVRSYGVEDMKREEKSDGTIIYKFAYPEIAVGTVVDEGFDIRYAVGRSLSQFVFPLQFDVPTEKVSVRFVYPKIFSVKTKKLGPSDRLAINYENPRGGRAVVYEDTDLPAVADEPYSPYFKEMTRYLEIAITGAYSETWLPSWSSFADGYRDYAVDKESFWRDRAEDIVEDVVDDSMSDRQKFAAIVGWLQKNIEVAYLEDADFNDVIKSRKGGPMLINGLARLMLDKVGIDANLILVHPAYDGFFDQDYIVYGTLTDPAIHAKIDGKDLVAVPHRKHYPIDLIPQDMQGQRALKIDEDGFAGFMTIPYGDADHNNVREVYNLSISEEGVITIEEVNELDGSVAYSVRRMLEDASETEIKELMEVLVTYDEGEVELDSWEIENQNDYDKPLTVRLSYTIDNLVTVTPEEVIVQTGGLLSPASSTGTKVDSDERVNPIRVYYDEQLEKQVNISYPQNWRLETELPKTKVANKFGSLSAEFEEQGGTTRITLSRTLNRIDAPAEEFGKMLDLLSSRSRYFDVPTLIFAVE